jgi:hypothetical protein
MKIVLVGHPGSQQIVPTSKYLVKKYLAKFDVTYLNYKGGINGWGTYIAGFLQYLTDKEIIFALDDYLISEPIHMFNYLTARVDIGGDAVCAKLCHATKEENLEYPVSTQYTLWNREYLIGLLMRTYTPWRFEIEGSKMFDKHCLHRPCIKYFTNSSLSSRWEGVRLDGLSQEDLNYINENKLIG